MIQEQFVRRVLFARLPCNFILRMSVVLYIRMSFRNLQFRSYKPPRPNGGVKQPEKHFTSIRAASLRQIVSTVPFELTRMIIEIFQFYMWLWPRIWIVRCLRGMMVSPLLIRRDLITQARIHCTRTKIRKINSSVWRSFFRVKKLFPAANSSNFYLYFSLRIAVFFLHINWDISQ